MKQKYLIPLVNFSTFSSMSASARWCSFLLLDLAVIQTSICSCASFEETIKELRSLIQNLLVHFCMFASIGTSPNSFLVLYLGVIQANTHICSSCLFGKQSGKGNTTFRNILDSLHWCINMVIPWVDWPFKPLHLLRVSFWETSQEGTWFRRCAKYLWSFFPCLPCVEFLRAQGSQSGVSVWQHTLVG